MSRDNAGNYTLPASYLAVTGQTGTATQHNAPLEDLAAAMSASLPVNGAKAMTGPIKAADGSVSSPSVTFNTDQTSGLYKTDDGFGVAVGGVQQIEFTNGLTKFPGGLALQDAGDLASAAELTLGDGNIFNITGTTAITSIATKGVGTIVWLRFDDALTLTHDATDLILFGGADITTAAGDWAIFEEYAAGDWRMVAYNRDTGEALERTLPPGFIHGLKVSNNSTDSTNDIDIAAGRARSDDDTVDIVLTSSITKQLDATWVVGTGKGGRDGTLANGTWHVFLILRSDTGVVDVLLSDSATDPTLPDGYDAKRRIGSVIRSSGTILKFYQAGDRFVLNAHPVDRSTNLVGGDEENITLTVPSGVKVLAQIRFSMNGPTNDSLSISFWDPDQSAISSGEFVAYATGLSSRESVSAELHVFTNTSGQIFTIADSNTANFRLTTVGWVDRRGQD